MYDGVYACEIGSVCLCDCVCVCVWTFMGECVQREREEHPVATPLHGGITTSIHGVKDTPY